MVKLISILFVFLLSIPAIGNISGKSCEQTINTIKLKKELKISLIIGYKDARPARFVGDRYEKNVVVYKLEKECAGEEILCGFKRSENDAFLFTKIWNDKKLLIRVLNSSVTEDDDENRQHPFQNWLSQRARKEFLLSLHQADILFYNGHSRAGGGPDFFPPLLKKDMQVDFTRYKNGYGSFHQILNYFKKINQPLKILGLFSCNATQLFEKDLATKQKEVMLITAPHLIYFKEALDKSLFALDAILRYDCNRLNQLL